MSPVLEALEQRAGASDRDREAWLADRRQGITGTEIRDLMLGTITDEELAALKLGRKADTFTGNAYTAWGKEREAVIERIVQQRFGIRPESRVFRAAGNSRHLMSPDGVGMNFDEEIVLSEIKTGDVRFDLAPWGADFEAKGYGYQIDWGHYVLDGLRTLYSWEGRHGRPGSFTPGELRHEWVPRNEERIGRMIARADQFLAVLDRMAAEPFEGPEPIDEVLDTHALNYLRGLAAEKDGKALKESAYRELVAAAKSQTSAIAKVTYTAPKAGVEVEVEEIDRAAASAGPKGAALLKALRAAQAAWDDHCEAFKTVRRETSKGSAAKVTVTAVKQKETK